MTEGDDNHARNGAPAWRRRGLVLTSLVALVAAAVAVAVAPAWKRQDAVPEHTGHAVGGPVDAPQDAFTRGERDARRDIAAGRLRLEAFGLMSSCFGDHVRVLRRDYAVAVDVVGSCIVDPDVVEHAQGYNGVMGEHLEARFGADWRDRADEQAELECAEWLREREHELGWREEPHPGSHVPALRDAP